MNILYLTWGENIGFSGLFQEQVVGQLKRIKKLDKNVNLFLLSGIPISRNLIKKNKEYKKYLQLNQESLSSEFIEMKWRYIFVLSNQFYSRFFILPFYYLGHLSFFKKYIINNQIDIVHCRSYHSAVFANIVKKIYKLDIKIIFDTRGVFPEEGVYFNFIKQNSYSYKLWKKIEKYLLINSSATVNVSDIMTQKFIKISSSKNIITIFTSNDVNIFIESKDNQEMEDLKNKLNINENNKILVHLGVIGSKSWYSLEKLIGIYAIFRNRYRNTKLIIITKANISNIDKYLNVYNIDTKDIIQLESNSSRETSNYLSLADYAIYPTRLPKNENSKEILDVLIAAKTGEYLASGLPILVHKETTTLANLVSDNKLGSIYNEIGDIEECLEEIDNNYEIIQQNNIKFAKEYFSNIVNAKKYLKLYEKLIEND
jgi:glycosyltransferase involved in cell wall biosynthesis